jgi:hypothetical protein
MSFKFSDTFVKDWLIQIITPGTDKFNTSELQNHRGEGLRDYLSIRGKS